MGERFFDLLSREDGDKEVDDKIVDGLDEFWWEVDEGDYEKVNGEMVWRQEVVVGFFSRGEDDYPEVSKSMRLLVGRQGEVIKYDYTDINIPDGLWRQYGVVRVGEDWSEDAADFRMFREIEGDEFEDLREEAEVFLLLGMSEARERWSGDYEA